MPSICVDLTRYEYATHKGITRVKGLGKLFPELSREHIEKNCHIAHRYTGLQTGNGFVYVETDGDDLVITQPAIYDYDKRPLLHHTAVSRVLVEVITAILNAYDSVGFELLTGRA